MTPSTAGPVGLLTLPQEIQDRIYDKYFEHAEATVRFSSRLEASSAISIRVQRVPSLALERTCSKVNKDSMAARDRMVSTHLTISSAKNISKTNLLSQLAENPKLSWLRGRTTSLQLDDESNMSQYPIDWRPFLNSFPQLNTLKCLISRTILTDRDHQELTDAILCGALDKSMADKAIFAPRLNSLAVALEEKFGADGYKVFSETTISFWNCYYSHPLWKVSSDNMASRICQRQFSTDMRNRKLPTK